MLTLARNQNNDIFAVNRGLAIARDADCQRMILESSVLTQRGELQFDSSAGVDYFGTVFQHQRYLPVWAAQMKSVVKGFSWLKSVDEFTYSFDRASAAVFWSMTVTTKQGDTFKIGSRGSAYAKGDRMSISYSELKDRPDIDGAAKTLDAISAGLADVKAKLAKCDALTQKDTLASAKSRLNEIVAALSSLETGAAE